MRNCRLKRKMNPSKEGLLSGKDKCFLVLFNTLSCLTAFLPFVDRNLVSKQTQRWKIKLLLISSKKDKRSFVSCASNQFIEIFLEWCQRDNSVNEGTYNLNLMTEVWSSGHTWWKIEPVSKVVLWPPHKCTWIAIHNRSLRRHTQHCACAAVNVYVCSLKSEIWLRRCLSR